MFNKSKKQMSQTLEQDYLVYLQELRNDLYERGLTETAMKVQQELNELSK